MPRKLSFGAVRAMYKTGSALAGAERLIRQFKPDVAVGMGGFASVPATLMAKMRRVPVVLHEQNSVPGRANRLLSGLAKVVAVSFQESERFFRNKRKVVLVGNPVRDSIERLDSYEAASYLGADPDKPTVLVFGGSRGARSINNAVKQMLDEGLTGYQLLHLTGTSEYASFEDLRTDNYLPFGYMEKMEYALSAADLVVSRAGASTISETAFMGIPAIMIPYPYATDDHQLANARALEVRGAAKVILDSELDGRILNENIKAILYNEKLSETMSEAMQSFASGDAAFKLARLVEEVAEGKI